MNARALRRLQLGLPNDVVVISGATFSPRSDINEWRNHRIDVATTTITLSTATGAGTEYWFYLGIASTNVVIKTNGTDVFQGFADLGVVGNTAKNFFTAGGTKNITFNGTTTGGANIGDLVVLTDIKSAVWAVAVETTASGSVATPFS